MKMKKLLVIILLSIVAFSCDVQGEIEAITEYINYFLDIETNKTEGTTNTEFTFTANTNDTVSEWLIDGVPESRSIDVSRTFSVGNHTISATTENGATDEVTISVSDIETIYRISCTKTEETSPIAFDGNTVIGAEKVTETETEYYKYVDIYIYVDNEDFYYFVNDNAYTAEGIDLNNMTADDLIKLIGLLFPPEEVNEYSQTVYVLTATLNKTIGTPELDIDEVSLWVDGERLIFTDYATYGNDTQTISFRITVDNSDYFLFVNSNMETFLGIDLQAMSYDDFVIAVNVINLYPEIGILELQEVYGL